MKRRRRRVDRCNSEQNIRNKMFAIMRNDCVLAAKISVMAIMKFLFKSDLFEQR